ncbi:type I restriction endonuclease subunit R [Lactobacillus sp. ESL0681]|uniref:type I restriction endonuclease subunit R n=1 Tax=Lactobacillus sp. ESL0681 TaxID=2983211 RepID=UPI0023F80095|nr:type I restriction endonuclease subunit R [Lactobacillus sp. ESL0681]WEV40696.1 type I restriction endonuclease subunit R [Lactobacillus sp. ESL0681]
MSKNSYLTEQDIEDLALDILEKEGYKIYRSPDSTKPNSDIDFMRDGDHNESILITKLNNALRTINPGYGEDIYRNAINQFRRLANSPDMMINNHYLHQLIIGGAKVKTSVKGESRTITLYPIDFKNINNNEFIATEQYTFKQGDHERRPDTTIFINGLPLITFEFKDSANEHVGLQQAYAQLQTYKNQISNYMQYSQILIISDGVNARVGSLTAEIDRFMRWRAPKDIREEGTLELEILLKYMLNPEDLLNIIQNFIIYETNADQTIEILAAYHQYYMVNKAVQRAGVTLKDPENKRIGVVWHTTGSGKSLSMVFFSGIVSRKLGNPTILVINDRNDLDDQLFGTFDAAHEFLQQDPAHAISSEDIREYLLRNNNSGGIVFSTIQKFSPNFEQGETEMPILSDRSNLIVIADEAHRTQYGLTAKYTKNGIRYGFAEYLREALPNASFIGFTGTPIDKADHSTTAVFGNYIDVYDITQAVNDHATVKIYYESHVFPLKLKQEAMEKYKQIITEAGLDDDTSLPDDERRNREYTRLEALAGAKPRLKQIAAHFVNHFEAREKQQFGKAMVVEISRKNAVKLYNEIIKLRPNWGSDDLYKGKIKIIMTSNASDGPDMAKHHTSKADRLVLQKRMKDNNDELQIVIVVDMWLTGFDVPSLNTMYIDKPMKGHNLIQAIARVNRVFKDKDSGLVVDYIGIAEALKTALNQYSSSDKNQVGINIDKAMYMLKEKYQIIKNDFLYGIDCTGYDSENSAVRLKVVSKVANELLREDQDTQQKFLDVVTQIQKLYALVSMEKESQVFGPEISFFKAVKVFIMKLRSNNGGDPGSNKNDKAVIDYRMNQLLDQSIISEPEVDLYKAMGIDRPNLDLISDKFLKQVEEMPEQDVAIALLEKILKGKVKAMQRTNIVKSGKFEDMLEEAIEKYNQRGITSEIVIRQLIQMAKDINSEQEKGKNLGLSKEEVAFYDALANYDKAVKVLGEEKLHLIAKELVKTVKETSGIDWNYRKSVQAKMRLAVKRLLKKYGYPPDIAPQAVSTVVEQAEKMAMES